MVKFLKIIPIAVKTGTVTIKYPYQEPLVTDSFRGAIEIDPNKCVGCGACTRICPPKALTLTTESNTMILRYFVGRCIFCGMCADTCPEKAIKITKEFELATGNIYDLYSDVEHEVKTCSICGKTFTSKKLSNKIASKVPDIPTETMDLCPDCRRKETLKKFIGVPEQ
ncbi:MAG: 4Fe-4S binding protein [Ignisphaera sp.]|uniref:4Fe-4S dicluster domain-containing protein n=1 Tax=Ignisphaera aggregans TaxID=334771 RepID=A0A7J3JNT0_9CREN